MRRLVRHPLSVTFAILIASTISIFTFSFGPPNPFKPILVLAGLAFDVGTLFRTRNLKIWNLVVGIISYIAVACLCFLAIFYLIDQSVVPVVAALLPVAGGIFVAFGIVLAVLLGRLLLTVPPARLRAIWRQIGAPE